MEMPDNQIMRPRAEPAPGKAVRALLLGRRLRLTGFEFADAKRLEPGTSPLLLRFGSGGIAALFPYGAAVLIGTAGAEEAALLQTLRDRIDGRLDAPIVALSEIAIGGSATIRGDIITLKDLGVASIVMVADALARHVAFTFEEREVGGALSVLAPFTDELAGSGRLPRDRRRMLRMVGQVLRTHQRLLERVERDATPDLPADDEDTVRVRKQLADVFHLKKRARSLSRKLDAIEVMTTALTELTDAQREMRVELVIVLLLVVEIAFWLYDILVRTSS